MVPKLQLHSMAWGVRTDSIVCYANSGACPYSGFVREVIAVAYGGRRSNGTHTWEDAVYSLRETRHHRNCVRAPTETKVVLS